MKKTLILSRHASYRKEGSNNNHEIAPEKHLNFRGIIEAIMLAKYFFELFLYRGFPIVNVIYTSNFERSIQTGKIVMRTLKSLLDREYEKSSKSTPWSNLLKSASENMRFETGYEEFFNDGAKSFRTVVDKEESTGAECMLAIVHQELLEGFLDGWKYPEPATGAILNFDEENFNCLSFKTMFPNALEDEFGVFKSYGSDDVYAFAQKLIESDTFQRVLGYYAPIHDFSTTKDADTYMDLYMKSVADYITPRNSHGMLSRYMLLGDPRTHGSASTVMRLFLENFTQYTVSNPNWLDARKIFVKEEVSNN